MTGIDNDIVKLLHKDNEHGDTELIIGRNKYWKHQDKKRSQVRCINQSITLQLDNG